MTVLFTMVKMGKDMKGKGRHAEQGVGMEKYTTDNMEKYEYTKQLYMETRRQLKQEVAAEAANTKLNRFNIQNQWRKILRMAKVESLRKDLEVLSQNHERDVDRKDAIIQMLDRDLEESEEQFQISTRSHMANVDGLIDLQDSRLLSLENEFEYELRSLEDEFTAEREAIVQQHGMQKKELLSIMSVVGAAEEDTEGDMRQEHEQNREEIRNKNLEEINVLRITLETIIEELERCFESAHLNYLENTDNRTQDFKFLTNKDEKSSKDIGHYALKIDRLMQRRLHWGMKITQNEKECQERNSNLREEKNIIAGHFQELKGRMTRFREREAKRLSSLLANANNAKMILRGKTDLASRILKLGELSRKLETQVHLL